MSPGLACLLKAAAAPAGALSGFAPRATAMALGAVLAVLQFVTTTTCYGAECDALVSTTPVTMAGGYALVFAVIAHLNSRRRLRRARRRRLR